MGVDITSEGTGRSSPEVGKKLMLGVEGDDGEGEFLKDRSGWGRRGDSGNRGFDNGGREILNRDVHKWDVVDNFFKLKVDISVLCFVGQGVLELGA